MKKICKNVVTLCVILCIVSTVFAAGGKENQSTTQSGPYKTYFYAWTHPDNMVPLINAFNKDYAGKYEMEYGKLADAKTMTINTALASGEQIDVMTQAAAIDMRVRADSGVYMGLKNFFDKDGLKYADIFGASIEQTQNINGDYYSLPYNNNINMVWYNKKMFDAAGVPYPKDDWTWADFRDVAAKLTKGTGANKVYGAMVDFGAPDGDYYWASIAQQKMGTFYYYNKDYTATRFEVPEMKESLQFFYDMAMKDKSIVPLDEYKTLNYLNDTQGMIGLYSGKYAMWIAPIYGCLYLNASYGTIPQGTDIGLANFPRPVDAKESSSTCYTSTASIPANVKNPEAAWATIKYICIDNAELFAGPKAMHPGYAFKTTAEADTFNKIIFSNKPGLDYNTAMRVMALPRKLITRDNTVVQGQSKINELMGAVMAKLFNGEITVDAALAEMKTKGDQYITDDLKTLKK